MIRNFVRYALLVSVSAFVFSAAEFRDGARAVASGNFAEPDVTASARQRPDDFVRGQVLVRFRDGVSSRGIQARLNALGMRQVRKIGTMGLHVVEVPNTAAEEVFVQALNEADEVEFAELDRIVPPAQMNANDPLFGEEWHLTRISAPSAWASNTGNTNVTIAILDTGVDGTHEDLAAKMVPGWNTFNNNSDTADVYGHGTKVAGTAASSSNNAIGVASVAWGCKIMPIRISDTTGYATYSAMAAGLNWAADHGARVANISYMASTSSTVKSAAQYFQSRGGVVVSSAGNNGAFDSTSDNPYILTVSATDPDDVPSSWSNSGNLVDLSAPESAYTTSNGGGYGFAAGTSFSSPIVAGVAALVMSANPNLTPVQVQDILKQNADDRGPAGWDPNFGWGRVNAARAVQAAGGGSDTTSPNVNFISPSQGSEASGVLRVEAAASDNVGVASVTLSVDGQNITTATGATLVFQWDTAAVPVGPHTLTATARDAAGNYSAISVTVTVVTVNAPVPDTELPTVVVTSPTDGARLTANIQVQVSASDNVGVVKNELYVDGARVGTSTSAPFTIRWSTKKLRSGAHTIQCKAFDAAGNFAWSQVVTVYK